MKVFIICPVRLATNSVNQMLDIYTTELEDDGITVHLPKRDTKQTSSSYDISIQNTKAIRAADEVHIFYDPKSTGTHFDLGTSFALCKKMKLIKLINCKFTEKESYQNMIRDWIIDTKV